MRGINTFDTFSEIVKRIDTDTRTPDAIIATGDLVQDETRKGYERFRKVIQHLNVPIHCIPGNHDSPRIMAEILNEPPFQFCGHAVYENWCLIMLNTAVRLDDAGNLAPDQLEYLQTTLQAHPDQHALICMHHHPLPMGSLWLDGLNLRNSEEFLNIVDSHTNVRGVVWGHVHQASDRERNGVRMVSTPSTGPQFLPGSDTFKMDSGPPGYRWIGLLPDGTMETEVVWL
jgi:Icc protein